MIKILCVEDNDDNIYMLKMRFEMLEGVELVTAEDGAAGCAMAGSEMPDVILMDLDLPVIDGWEATRRIKGRRDAPYSDHRAVGTCDVGVARAGDCGRLRRIRYQASRLRPPHEEDRSRTGAETRRSLISQGVSDRMEKF